MRFKDLAELPGVGEDLADKIETLAETGHMPVLDEIERRTPAGLLALLDVPGLGPKRAKLLNERLGVCSLAELVAAAKAGRIRELPGFGERTEERILEEAQKRVMTTSRIKARGIYRDPVRSSQGHFVKTSGLRWLSLMVVVPISWSGRHWALPFLTVLAPSVRWSKTHRKRHKTLTDWARQAILQTKRWVPNRPLIVVADSGFAAVELLAAIRRHVGLITRLRRDAALYKPAPPRRTGQRGRTPLNGRRRPSLQAVLARKTTIWTTVVVSQWYNAQQRKLQTATGTALWDKAGVPPVPIRWVLVRDPQGEHEPAAFLSTDLEATPAIILGWFVSRWRVETTFQEVRTHLGVETQRQWSDLAILRTTPALLGLFSLITVWADGLVRDAA